MKKVNIAILEEDSALRDRISALVKTIPQIKIVSPPAVAPPGDGTRCETAAKILIVNVDLARRNELLLSAEQDAAIIAFANSAEAALEAFNLRAVDCLLEPVQSPALMRALQRAFDYLELRATKSQRARPVRASKKYLRQIRVKTADRVLFVPSEEVLWIEAQDNYVRIHTDSRAYMQRGRISEYEAALDPEQFLRVNRSALVNVRHIAELRSMFKGAYTAILRNGTRVSMVRSIDKLEKILNASGRRDKGEAVPAEFARS